MNAMHTAHAPVCMQMLLFSRLHALQVFGTRSRLALRYIAQGERLHCMLPAYVLRVQHTLRTLAANIDAPHPLHSSSLDCRLYCHRQRQQHNHHHVCGEQVERLLSVRSIVSA